MKRFALSIICLVLALTALGFGICNKGGETATTLLSVESQGQTTTQTGEISQTCLGDLTILMYHNTLAKGRKQSVYCINQDSLRRDFQYLKDNGYSVISCKSLIEYVDNGASLPDKAAILTFDDGYLNNMTYALPLLEEFGYSGLFSVVGDYTVFDKKGGKGGGDFVYFGWDDIAEVAKNTNVEIGLHSYSMHNTRPRLGVAQLKSESDDEYKQVFSDDTQKLVDKLGELGVTSNIYAYPYGKYTKISESVLKDKGVAMTLTCNEGINHIYGRRSLYLLKRINRDATKGSLGEVLGKYGA